MKNHPRLVLFARLAAGLLVLASCLKSYGQLPVIHRIKRVQVDSEAVNFIGYHHKTKTLEIQFHSGETYRYAKVPVTVYHDFLKAESKGRYFREHIRGRYDYWRVKTK